MSVNISVSNSKQTNCNNIIEKMLSSGFNSRIIDTISIVDNTIPVGTERYMAPEVKNTSDYDNKIDIYSCGILLYELFEEKKYIPGVQMKWYYTPKTIRNIITTKMFCEDPKQRFDALSIIKILNHYNI